MRTCIFDLDRNTVLNPYTLFDGATVSVERIDIVKLPFLGEYAYGMLIYVRSFLSPAMPPSIRPEDFV